MKWERGRQGTGYEKIRLASSNWPLPFDVYILRYRTGAHIPLHTDPNPLGQHWRCNITLWKAAEGGEYFEWDAGTRPRRIRVFRPDKTPHGVKPVVKGTRYVLSIGWLKKAPVK